MALKVTMEYVDSQGDVASTITATYDKMEYADIVKTQDAIVNTLINLGYAGAELKAKRDNAKA